MTRARLALSLALALGCRAALPPPRTPLTATPDPDELRTPPPAAVAPLPEATAPATAVERFTLSNGLTVMLVPRAAIPTAAVVYVNRRGGYEDRAQPPGMAAAAVRALATSWELHGAASPQMSLDHEASYLLAAALPGEVPALAAGLVRALHLRDDHQAPVLRAQWQIERWAAADADLAAESRALRGWLFGPGHLLAQPVLADDDRAGVQFAEIQSYLESHYAPGESALVVVGAVERAGLREALEAPLRVWAPRAVPTVTPPPVRFVLRGPVASFNEDATSTQVHVSIAIAALDAPSDDGPALRVLNRVLGGAPGSRLNDELRTAQGLTYGFESNVRAEGGASWLGIDGSFRADAAREALTSLMRSIEALRARGPSPEEFERARRLSLDEARDAIATNPSLALYLARSYVRGAPTDAVDHAAARVAAVTLDDVRRVAQRVLARERIAMVLRGPIRPLEGALRELGCQVVKPTQ